MRAFVPAKIKDNPSVNKEEYEKNLMHLGPVVRERLMNGDWTIMPTGLIKADWIRYFRMRGQLIDLLVSRPDPNGEVLHTQEILNTFDERTTTRFITVDTAGGSKDITAASKGKQRSWSVAAVWDRKLLGSMGEAEAEVQGVGLYSQGQTNVLLLRDVWRAQCGFVEVATNLVRLSKEWQGERINPVKTIVEDKTMGLPLVDLLSNEIEIQVVSTGTEGKVERNTAFQNMMSRGEVYFPFANNSWLQTYLAEILSWQGIEGETNDQIDVSSYAALECGGMHTAGITLDYDPRESLRQSLPGKWGW